MSKTDEVGYVKGINNFLLSLDGLPTIKVNDVVESQEGLRAWVSSIFERKVDAFLLDESTLRPGQMFRRREKPLSVGVGDYLLGRAVNPIGVPVDGKGPFGVAGQANFLPLDVSARGIKSRQFISTQLETGIKVVDLLLPLGKGQRELVIGDARSGKTSFLIDLVVNQKQKNVICIYAAIGKPLTEIRSLIDSLEINKALSYSVIIATSSSDPAPLIFLAPQTAFSIAEYFQKKGRDVLVILDDLGNHAKIYREMALLAGRTPGRESYPGDIFYQHSHLLERAGNFKKEEGGGSITALPVIEINLIDFTTLIPTNLMSMTDGHLMFKSSLYNQGHRPGVDISLSVSRVGPQTQTFAQKFISNKIKSILAQAGAFKTLSSFSGELSLESQLITKQEEILQELLNQEALVFVPIPTQVGLLSLGLSKFLISQDVAFTKQNKRKIVEILTKDSKFAFLTNNLYKSKDQIEFEKYLEFIINKIQTVFSKN